MDKINDKLKPNSNENCTRETRMRAAQGKPGPAGAGGMIRDHLGKILLTISGPLSSLQIQTLNHGLLLDLEIDQAGLLSLLRVIPAMQLLGPKRKHHILGA
ncbi:hypothetical protein AMTR_s00025p00145710 [Amborella trichopoda]|uniref:Uncharacterized protein n=1 Tax=Amborella trichopoda TaxID=13333 RepID=W1PX79_AMBTC|nr:hypothetical protein AMTR_s00025p00145710 [Amborella trichopoda]